MAPPAGRNRALFLLTLIYLFNFMDRQIMAVLAEPIRKELLLSDTQIGLLTGFMFALFYTSFGVPVAWFADRTRRSWVIAGACTLWSGFCAACGLATGFASLALARIGVAVGEAGGVAPSYSLISDFYPVEERGRAIAVFSMGVPLGLGVGTAAGGWIAATYGWRTAFFVVAAPGILLALLLVLLVREPEKGATDTAPLAARAGFGATMAMFFSSPRLLLVTLSASLGAFTCYGLMAWISAYLQRVLGMTLKEVGSYLSITLAISLGVGIWLSGYLADRHAAREPRMYAWIPAVALALGAPALLIATRQTDWHVALPLFGVAIGLSVFYLAPSVAALSSLVPAAQRSTANATMLLFLNLIGLGGGPYLIGVTSDWAKAAHGTQSLRIAFTALTPMFLVAALACLASARALGQGRSRDGLISAS
ncbi:MAG: MFS transporter [Sphingomicrobium sp.]